MSRIYFHSIEKTAEVPGTERAYCSVLLGDLLVAALGLSNDFQNGEHLRSVVTPGHYSLDPGCESVFGQSIRTAVRIDDEGVFTHNGVRLSTFHLCLNTALAIGGDAIRFLARVHGQCEIHGYVEGENRRWLADLIEAGQGSGVLRDGWESAIELLRETTSGPVVMSYSVCESFPSGSAARDGGWVAQDERDDDEFWNLPEEERWKWALAGIRSEGPYTLELKPENWQTYRFGSGFNAFQLVASLTHPRPRPQRERST